VQRSNQKRDLHSISSTTSNKVDFDIEVGELASIGLGNTAARQSGTNCETGFILEYKRCRVRPENYYDA